MISSTIASALTASTSSQRKDSSSQAATDDPSDSASFSSAMASAKAASPSSNASNSESGDAPKETPADSAQGQTTANGQTASESTPSRGKTASANATPGTTTTSRKALVTGPDGVPDPAPDSPKGLPASMRVFVQDAEGGANSQTGAKRGADKATSSTENPKPNTPATADTSAPVCATNAASADASVAALVQGAAAQTIRGNLGSAVSGEQAALPPSVLSAGTASRALAGVDAGATAAVATAQGENQPLPVPSLVSNANASATGTVPSFASLFARPERSEGAMATGVTQDAIGKSALPSAGTLTELAPTTTLASLAVAPAHGAASGSGYAEVNIATRVGDLGFEQDISRQLVFLAKTGVQSAELSLQPSELGPVSVSIQMNGLQASLVISAGHAVTRAALQEALPHLSELFQNSGLQLTNAQVGDGSARNADQGPAQRHALVVNDPLGSSVGARATTIGVDSTAGGRIVGSRLIDTFA